jgi:hypothetical protein
LSASTPWLDTTTGDHAVGEQFLLGWFSTEAILSSDKRGPEGSAKSFFERNSKAVELHREALCLLTTAGGGHGSIPIP